MNDHSAIVDNIAGLGGGASIGAGGGVSTYLGTLRMRENSTIARNTATTQARQGSGGGIFNRGYVFLNGNSTVTESATGLGTTVPPGLGGGVFNAQYQDCCGDPPGSGTLTLNGGRVCNNTPNDICTSLGDGIHLACE